MLITAKLSFKHAFVMNTLKDNGIRAKDFCTRFEVPYGSFLQFCNLKTVPRIYKDKILNAFQSINPDINIEDLFPNELKSLIPVLRPRESTQDVQMKALTGSIDKLIPYIEDPEQNKEEEMVSQVPSDLVRRLMPNLTERQRFVIENYFGFSGKKIITLDEIGKKLKVTGSAVMVIKNSAIKRLAHIMKMNKNLLEEYGMDSDLIKIDKK